MSVDLYTTAICPYCVAAKNFLTQRGFTYREIRIDLDRDAFRIMLERSGGRRSVPQIFIGDVHIGGYDDLVAADRAGRLAEFAGNGSDSSAEDSSAK